VENLIQQFENSFKIQSQKLEEHAKMIQQLKEDTIKQINKVDEKYTPLKDEIKKAGNLPKEITSVESKLSKRIAELKNQTDTLKKKN